MPHLVKTGTMAFLFAMAGEVCGQNASLDVRKILVDVVTRAQSAKEYLFEADLQLDGQRGKAPGRNLSSARVKLAVAPGGKYLLEVQPLDKDEYTLVCDGQKSWAYVPRLKEYTEEDSASTGAEEEDGASDSERDMAETFSRQVVPILARMIDTAAEANGVREPVELKYEGKKYKWPAVRVFSKKTQHEGQSMTEIVVDPETMRIGRLVHANVSYRGDEKTVIRMQLNFRTMQLGGKVPEESFVFEPPKKAKLVDAVPIPGQTGSFLLNKPAPDFELKTLDGEKVRLSELKSKPVLLSFWASWCPPCRRELPELAKIYDEYEGKGLVLLGVNDEGRGTARSFAEKARLPFPTLDDSSRKAHRLYRVSSIPTVFLIDRDGKIVRFFRGAKDEAAFRAALKGVGF
jgi:peroxiredoxin/outer membrane lipoprotein-sorting protein